MLITPIWRLGRRRVSLLESDDEEGWSEDGMEARRAWQRSKTARRSSEKMKAQAGQIARVTKRERHGRRNSTKVDFESTIYRDSKPLPSDNRAEPSHISTSISPAHRSESCALSPCITMLQALLFLSTIYTKMQPLLHAPAFPETSKRSFSHRTESSPYYKTSPIIFAASL